MNDREPRSAASRRAVSELVRRFFADLTTQLTAGTAELWKKVEGLALKPPQGARDGSNSPGAASPEQSAPPRRQPVQQPQTKAEPNKE